MTEVTPREPRVDNHGPVAFHDQRCAVLPREFAVIDCQTEVFQPSWRAQIRGWRLVCADTWFKRLALRLAFGVKP